MLKKIAYVFGAWLIGMVAVALYLNNYDWNRARPLIARYSQKFTGTELRIAGPLEVHLGMHPVVVASDVTYGGIFKAGHIEGRVDIAPVFKNILQISYIRLYDARIELGGGDEAAQAAPKKGRKSKKIDWRVLTLDLADVTIAYGTTLKADISRLTATAVGDGDLMVTGRARVNGLPVSLKGSAQNYRHALLGDGRLGFDFEAHVADLTAEAAGHIGDLATLGGLEIDAALHGKNLQDVVKTLGIELNDKVPQLDASTHIAHDGGTWRITKADARLGKSQIGGEATISTRNVLNVVATVRSSQFLFEDLGPFLPKRVATELPAAKQAKADATGKPVRLFSDKAIPLDFLHKIDADLSLSCEHFVGPDKAALIESFNGRVRVRNGKLEVEPLVIKLAEGEISTRLVVDAQDKTPHTTITADVRRVDIGKLSAPFLENDALSDNLSGKLTGRIALKASGGSLRAMMSSLDGRTALALEDGKMSGLIIEALGMDLTEAIGTLTAKRQTVDLECLIADLRFNHGAVKPEVILASTGDSDVIIQGDMSLENETLDVIIKTQPKDFSIGSIRTPITVKGPLSQLKVGVVKKELAARLAVGIALGVFVNPVAALAAFVEPGLQPDGKCRHYLASTAAATAH